MRFSLRSVILAITVIAVLVGVSSSKINRRLEKKEQILAIRRIRKSGADVYYARAAGIGVVFPGGAPAGIFCTARPLRSGEDCFERTGDLCLRSTLIDDLCKIDGLSYIDFGEATLFNSDLTRLVTNLPMCTVIHDDTFVSPEWWSGRERPPISLPAVARPVNTLGKQTLLSVADLQEL